jgi:hypothetical protein
VIDSRRNGPGGPWIPGTGADREAVRDQLARLLANPLFRNSKRAQLLLRFAVEHTFHGTGEHLKERTLGAQVFGRDAQYDTNQDPIVRMTAVEIRKRLAQYYQEPGHESEIQVDFPQGSYVPEFRMPSRPPASPDPQPVPEASPAVKQGRGGWQWAGAAVIACALLGAGAWSRPWGRETSLDRFWSPVLDVREPVLVCIPSARIVPEQHQDRHQNALLLFSITQPDPKADQLEGDFVRYGDAMALSMVSGLLRSRDRPFRVRRGETAGLDDLRDGPVILLGPSQWSNRLTEPLRFRHARDGAVRYIRDRQNPADRKWSLPGQVLPGETLSEDYALISRILDPTTGHFAVLAMGLYPYGTRAAAEFLTDPARLEETRKSLPGDWKGRNIQIVLSTQVVGENSGQPRILAVHVW